MSEARHAIAEALFECLSNAQDEDLKAIATEMKKFRDTYFRSYQGVCKQPFAHSLLSAIEEALRYRDICDEIDQAKPRSAAMTHDLSKRRISAVYVRVVPRILMMTNQLGERQ